MTAHLRKVAAKIRRLPRPPQSPAPPTSAGPTDALPEWEHIPTWLPADQLRGWQDSAVVGTQQERWNAFLQQIDGPEPLGVSHESPASLGREQTWCHNLHMTYGYVLGRAAQFRTELSILDWGAGVGHYYAFTRALLPETHLHYTAYDFTPFCEIGQGLLPHVRFVDNPQTALQGSYQLVMAGSSLWYSQQWQETLKSLAAATADWIYITRMIFVRNCSSFVVIQRPWKHGYNTEYQCWVLNRQSFLDAAENCGLRLEREFFFGPAPAIHGAPEAGTFRGFLFRRSTT